MRLPALSLSLVLGCLAQCALAQTPAAFPGLQLWLDAADPATLQTNAFGRVSKWTDKSGRGFHATQVDTNRMPLVQSAAMNGRTAVRFDGASASNSTNVNDDGLYVTNDPANTGIPTLNLVRPYSIFIVDQYWDNGVRGRTLQSQDANWLIGKWAGNHSHYVGAFVGPNRPATAFQPALGSALGGLFDTMYGIQSLSNGRVGNNGSPGRMALGTPTLFNQANGYREPSRADVSEVVAYNRVLSDAEQRAVEAHLSAKWGLPRPWGRHFATQTVRFTGGDPGEGLDFQGNFLAAVDVGGAGGFTIGDAVFTDDVGGDPAVTVTAQNWAPNWTTAAFGFTPNDAGLNQLCASIRWHNGVNAGTAENPAATRASVQGLTPGNAYKVQVILFEGCCPGRHQGVQINGDLVKRNFNAPAIQGAPNTGAGAALVHTFVATNTVLDLVMRSADVNGGDKNPILNGFTVEDLGAVGVASVAPITDPYSLDIAGTFIHAFDFAGNSTQTVRGLDFLPAETSSGVFIYAENNIPAFYRPDLGADADSEALENVLQSIRWEQTDQEEQVVAVDLGALQVGYSYRLQLLFAENPAAAGERRFDVVINGVVVSEEFFPLAVTGRAANQATLFTYDFFSTSTNLNIVLDGRDGIGVAGMDPNPILSGLTLEEIGPFPFITAHPADQEVLPGAPAEFRVAATGTPPLHYSWHKDGLDLSGETLPVLLLPAAAAADAGEYRCVVSNLFGVVTSNVARLDLLPVPPVAVGGVAITEFLASNQSGLRDEDGDREDWIELHNANAFPVNLDGWRLTDTETNLVKWVFPTTVLPAGGYLVVFASDKDRRVPGGEPHTNFKLSAGGEYLALVNPAGVIVQEFSPLFPAQRDDLSFGLAHRVTTTELLPGTAGAQGRYHVPASNALADAWKGGAEPFADASWTPATLPIGYDRDGGLVDPPVAIVGHPLQNRGTVDGAVGGIFVQSSTPFTESGVVDRWTMYAGAAGRQLTPLILQASNGVYVITGIGATRTSVLGLQTNQFELVSGSAEAAPGRFVAWKDGGQGANNAGVISWNVSSEGTIQYFNQHTTFTVGENLGAGQFFERQYSVRFEVRRSLDSLLRTDVEPQMFGVTPGLFLRLPFTLAGPPVADALLLRVRYEDGFVAWLNGTLVAERNQPALLAYDSAATADRTRDEASQWEEIDLTAHLGLLHAGTNVLAVQALNESVSGAEFLFDASLSTVFAEDVAGSFMPAPTPGSANGDGYDGLVADTSFTPKRGFYDSPQSVTITCSTPGAAIWYTTDGSEPVAGGSTLYTGPIAVNTTTYLRARAVKDGHLPTNVDTHTYVFPGQVQFQAALPPGLPASWAGIAGDYEMDPDVTGSTLAGYAVTNALRSLPVVSLVMPHNDWWGSGSGIYYNSSAAGPTWERKVSLEFFTPDGTERWQVECGVEINGNSSRGHGFTPKHSFRLSFKDEYGPSELKRNLFPDSTVDNFDQLTLRGCSTDSWPVQQGYVDNGVIRWDNTRGSYLRDQWMRDVLRDLGQPNSHGRYVHLYLNGLYWGVYNLAERLNDGWAANHLGGNKDEYDVIKDFSELQSGNMVAWNQLMAAATAGFPDEAAFQALQGNQPDGTRNPNLPVLLDVDNFIDYMICHIYGGAEDWATHNYWASRRRGPNSEGFRFYAWDQEISNDSLVRTQVGSHVGGDRFELADDFGPAGSPVYVYSKLRVNPSFRQRFRDRAHALVVRPDGPLTPAANAARWLARQQEIDLAMVAESARWGDYRFATPAKRETNWLTEMNWMATQYWPGIHPIAIARFQNAGLLSPLAPPSLGQNGGTFSLPFSLSLSHTNAVGALHYTLNGMDPRGVDGAPSASALPYTTPIAFTNGPHRIIARVRNGTDWSAPVEAVFTPFDTDGDGLPDAWESANGTSVSIADAGADPDGDGHSNLQEFIAGTHPNNTLNVLRVAEVLNTGAHLRVRFPTVNGRTYHVETAELPAGPWTGAATVPGTGALVEVDIALPPSTGRLYARVRTGG